MRSTRREFIGAIACSAMIVIPGSASARTEQTDFMIDAIKDIRKTALLPTTDDAIRVRPALSSLPNLWGAVAPPIPFADFDWYYTSDQFIWHPNKGQNLPSVTVPAGFCSDLTSVPSFFWSFGLPKTGRYAFAAIVHDYLYWTQTTTRQVADEILYTAMVDSGVSTITREAINLGVAKTPYFSQSAWDKNTKAKKGGAKRLLKKFPPRDQIVSWEEWSKDPAHFLD